MSFDKQAIAIQVDSMIQADENEISGSDRAVGIDAALERYSRDAPDHQTEDITGDGGRYYAVSDLTYFKEDYSRIVRIEYPAQSISADEVPQLLEPEDWDDNYRDGSNMRYIYFPNHTPAATETLRITYTAPYTFVSNAVDLPPQNFYAFCNLVACEVCRYIATKYARTSDNTITGDSVDHAGRSDRFRQMSKEFCDAYNQMMGFAVDGETAQGGSMGEFVDWNTSPGWPSGRSWMFNRG